VCGACQQAKSHQLPYSISTCISTKPLELVFSDVWGPTIDSVGKNKYYVSFIDDFNKFTWIYLFKNKSEVVNTKNWYKKGTDLWAEFGKEAPFGRKFSSKDSVKILAVGSTPSFGRRAVCT
jgi:hypothetical protein